MQLLNQNDSLERQNEKLTRIAEALMRRVEQSPDQAGMAYAQFERAALLEQQVRQRTHDLERTLSLLHDTNGRLAQAIDQANTAEENLSQAIETIDEGFALFDAEDCLVLHNSRFCKDLLDVRDKLLPGLSFIDYVAAVSESQFLEWQDGQDSTSWLQTRLEHHREDHVVFNVRLIWDRWLQVSEHRTSSGGTVILQTDVSEIMRLERRERDKLVHRQARMLRATLDHLNQGVVIFDRQGLLVGWNQQMEALLSRPLAGTVLGMPFDDLLARIDQVLFFSGDVDRDTFSAWAKSQRGRQPISFEVRRDDDGIFSVFAQEMPDKGFVISFSDVTLERQTAQALRHLNDTLERRVSERTDELGAALADTRQAIAAKTRFVAAASHDLLQPMSAAKLYASALEDRLGAEDDRALARKTVSALESAEAIIEALLDISKLDSGQASFNIRSVSLSEMLTGLASEFAPMAAQRGRDLRVVPSSLRVESDPVFLRRIVQNLISNAIRYTTQDRILVGARKTRDGARIEVWDRGPGIAAPDQSRIFEEFRQLGGGGGEGLGLGLAIVDRACKMLGHTLALWSEPGLGSCFSITLDYARSDVRHIAGDETRAAAVHTQGLVVGLVENDAELASSISLTVESAGSDVIHADTGEAALKLLDDLGIVPDGFLIDYQLGEGMDGLDLVRHLRGRYGAVPIEIISADRTPELAHDCAALNVALRHKPLSRNALTQFLASIRGQ